MHLAALGRKEITFLASTNHDFICYCLHENKPNWSHTWHSILCRPFFGQNESEIGLTGKALDWFKSYFTRRTTCVLINDIFSNSIDMEYGLPQGSTVGPKSFTIYSIPIGRITKQHNLSYHIYADDILIFTSFIPSDSSSIQSALSALELCISDISKWMTANMLKLNSDKTAFFVATPHHFKKLMSNVHLQIDDEMISHLRTYATCVSFLVMWCQCQLM